MSASNLTPAPSLVHRVVGRPEQTVVDLERLGPDRLRIVLKRRSPQSVDPDDFHLVAAIAFDASMAAELRAALAFGLNQLEAGVEAPE